MTDPKSDRSRMVSWTRQIIVFQFGEQLLVGWTVFIE
jgi:hypothetical protein